MNSLVKVITKQRSVIITGKDRIMRYRGRERKRESIRKRGGKVRVYTIIPSMPFFITR